MGQTQANWLWPTITDTATARQAARGSFWAAIISAAMTSLFAGLSLAGIHVIDIEPVAFVDAAIMLLIAVGIRRMSRAAAVLGLCLYLAERLLASSGGTLLLTVFFVLMYVNSIRGTFAYHRFMTQTVPGSLTTKP
jgi:hypothetical protein